MKHSDIFKAIGAGFLATSLAVVPLALPASAQDRTNTAPNSDTDTSRRSIHVDAADDDNAMSNWGWLGLLGLLGLSGLARKREEPVPYREAEPPSSSSYTP